MFCDREKSRSGGKKMIGLEDVAKLVGAGVNVVSATDLCKELLRETLINMN
jgi:hypothetical protein